MVCPKGCSAKQVLFQLLHSGLSSLHRWGLAKFKFYNIDSCYFECESVGISKILGSTFVFVPVVPDSKLIIANNGDDNFNVDVNDNDYNGLTMVVTSFQLCFFVFFFLKPTHRRTHQYALCIYILTQSNSPHYFVGNAFFSSHVSRIILFAMLHFPEFFWNPSFFRLCLISFISFLK